MTKWQPSSADYSAVIRSQNPWQSLGIVPKTLAPDTYRPLAKVLWQTMMDERERRHQIILGPRRVGKTTVMYQTVKEMLDRGKIKPNRLWWLRLDHPLLMDWHLGDMVSQIVDIAEAKPSKPAYLFLDELTYAERWDLWLKTFYDEQWPVRIVGTSSATAVLRDRATESGVGRWDEHYLAPYLFTEFLALRDKSANVVCESSLGLTISSAIHSGQKFDGLEKYRRRFVLTGGFPELLLDEKLDSRKEDDASELLRSQRTLRSDAIEKAIYKDIPQAFSIQEPSKLERLLYILAGQITGILSAHAVGSDMEMSPPTVERYVGFLERAFIVFNLSNYSASEESVQRRGKRLYFVDGAVRNAALLRGIAPIEDPHEMGLLIENMAASHLRALAYQEGVRLYHWREKSHEVDLVYDHPNDPLAFEVTVGRKHHVRGLKTLQERFPKFRGCCYLVSPNVDIVEPTFDSAGSIPLDLFLCAVGTQEECALMNRVAGRRKTEDGQLLLF